MSFLKIETERSDAGSSNVHSSDSAFANTKTVPDVNFYKDVIKGLQAELSKVKAENEQLRETVLAYSINLPQVSRKLNTLVACLEAKSFKVNRLKERRRNEDADESHFSEGSSLNDVEDGECELQDEASEGEANQTIKTATSDRVPVSVQNYVEVICEEDNSVEDGVSTNGDVNDGVVGPGNRKFHNRGKKENSMESTHDTSIATARTMTSRSRKLKNLKETPVSKFKHVREGIIKKNSKQKRTVVQDGTPIQEQVQEFSAFPSEELKSSLEELHMDKMDAKIKLEESLEERVMTENVACENIKVSKLRRALQESVISTASNQKNENPSNETTESSRRGRRRAYDCEVCGRTFARSSNLAHHVMRHRNERPHRCEICDRAFVQKANLKVHLRSHTGERPFSCTECGRAFAQKNNALRHLRAHARQRQLQEQKLVCPICGKTFGRWPSYETHMRRTHSNPESNSSRPVTHCVVNDSHPANIAPSIGGISGSSPHPSVSVSHHAGSSVTNSQLPLEHASLESVLPSTVALVSVHASDNINNGHISEGHHPQNEHVLVGSHVTLTAQLNGSHCTDSNC